MTYGDVISEARRLARVSTQGLSDANALPLVNKVLRRFFLDTGGFRYTRRLQVMGTFIPETFEGFHLTIVGSTNNDIDSDVAVTDEGGSRLTGTEMASKLQEVIRAAIGAGADLTVAWANFYFTVDGIDSTSIAITSPESTVTYVDAVAKYFGEEGTGVTEIENSFPEGCTVATTAPTGLRGIQSITWKRWPLSEAGEFNYLDPQPTGTPAYYYQDNWGYILLFPTPTTQEELSISYSGVPELSTSPTTTMSLPTELPDECVDGLAWKLSAEMLLGAFDDKYADRRQYEYETTVKRYLVMKANRNTESRQGRNIEGLPYRVGWN